MKSKIVVFKMLAAIIAIGGAILSVNASSAAQSAYVRYTTAATNAIYCTEVGSVCNDLGGTACKINVTWVGQTTPVGYNSRITDCGSVIADHNSTAVAGSKFINKSGVRLQ